MQRHPARQAFIEEAQEDEGGIDLASLPIDREYEIPSAGAGIAPERASALISQFDRKRRAAQLAVPTDDGKVRSTLRSMGEPITLFGEGPGDRRDRLRELMLIQVEIDGEGAISTPADTPMNDVDDQPMDEEFYTEGTPDLLAARQAIARYSLPRAKARTDRQKQDSTIPLRTHIKYRKSLKEKLSTFELYGTQIAGERPVSITRFSPNNEIVAAGNWLGGIKLLSVPDLEERTTLRGHTGMVGGIDWYPGSTLPTSNVSPGSLNLASGAGGGGQPNEINLWSLESETPLATLHGHTDRVARIAFHPSGQYLASASFDTTWRLWDVNHTPPGGQELLLQEGHSRPVYALSFSPDGSLLASGGFDSIGRIWDLRSGRTVMILEGHIREIYSLDWGADGYRVLSGSGDGWVKCWDLRAVRNIGGLGAHKGNVSDLRWYKGTTPSMSFPTNDVSMTDSHASNGQPTFTNGDNADNAPQPRPAGTFLVTSGFDKNVNVFSADDWSLIKQLSGHSGNVLSCDISNDAKWIASSGHDRTVKIWGRENTEDL